MEKRAILFGINEYQFANNLRFCVKDAEDWANALKDKGYECSIIVNESVTIDRYTEEVEKAFKELNKGDYLVVAYSGHGTQYYDYSEKDQIGEGMYLRDGIFKDDDFEALMSKNTKGINVRVIMDCCFAEDNTKDTDVGRSFIPDFVGNLIKHKKPRKTKKFFRDDDLNYIALWACSENQTSADSYLLRNGAFTHYAIKAIEDGNQTCKDYWKEVRKHLPSKLYDQIPIMGGNKELFHEQIF